MRAANCRPLFSLKIVLSVVSAPVRSRREFSVSVGFLFLRLFNPRFLIKVVQCFFIILVYERLSVFNASAIFVKFRFVVRVGENLPNVAII